MSWPWRRRPPVVRGCFTCAFWRPDAVGVVRSGFEPTPMTGACHAHPPTPATAHHHLFPRTEAQDWCGEWKDARR